MSRTPQPDPVVLVTGASTGIGRATALAAAAAGFTVVAGMRKPTDLDGVDVRELDVTDPDSVAACVGAVLAAHGRLDAVVNNAGIANNAFTLERASLDAIRANLEVNLFGVLAVTRAALPHLRATRGRVVTVGSVRGVIGQPFNEAYSAAKFAVEGYLEALAPTAAAVGVTICIVEPAAVLDTAFVASSPLDPAALLASAGPYADAFRAYRRFVASGAVEGAQTAAEVAAVIVAALTAEAPPFRIPTSAHAARYLARKLADVDGTETQAMTRAWLA
ncbi:SDR family NAD(P)-dependent oxidoreductase [Dactylosporangium sp. NPDC048998]|uniref:SDR family NAD(P)-dependent oxidoreductase n=1 Tax=Dactylosporangium sp. NPDC048998 TaxID=3363976 RepID=UPI003710D4CD